MQPAIVLARPQLGENIGMVARAMWNFGLTDLRLVSPRDGWPNPDAGPPAVGADHILDSAQVFDSVAAAVADCHKVFATAMRLPDVITPAESAARTQQYAGEGKRVALLFGPERTGLSTDEVAFGDALLTIPANPDFASLNIAMAVTLIAYEWFKLSDATPASVFMGDKHGPATRAAVEGLVGHLDVELSKRGYFHPDHRKPTMLRTLRSIIQRLDLTGQEVLTLRGVVKFMALPPEDERKR
jgi:tRNA/rRNA methyltransferase